MTDPISSDYSQRYRELHVAHLALMQDRYRDQRLDATQQALASDHADRIQRAQELGRDLGQNIDRLA
jgi:hypothetical protein